MTRGHRRYLIAEMSVAAAISAVLSIVFVLLLFGGLAVVPVTGAHGLIVDAVPQSAMIALMSSVVPTLLTRRRVGAGAVAPLPGRSRLPRNAAVRAIVVALVVAILAGLAHAVLLPLGPAEWPIGAVLTYKPLYGAMLGAVVARGAVIAALADRVVSGPGGSAAATGRRGA